MTIQHHRELVKSGRNCDDVQGKWTRFLRAAFLLGSSGPILQLHELHEEKTVVLLMNRQGWQSLLHALQRALRSGRSTVVVSAADEELYEFAVEVAAPTTK